MSLKNYAIYSLESGLIDNVAYIDENDLPNLIGFPAEGFGIVELPITHGDYSACGIGWSYINGEFIEPPKPEEPLAPEQPATNGAETL